MTDFNYFYRDGYFVTDELRPAHRNEDAIVRSIMNDFSFALTGNQLTLLERALRRAYWAGRRDEDKIASVTIKHLTERLLTERKSTREN